MRKNGFTLIELLAVIVILAIIALIATPIILGIINDAREKSNERSAQLYLNGVELAVARRNLIEEFNPNKCIITEGVVTCEGYDNPLNVEVDGDVPTEGIIVFSNNKVTLGTELRFDGFNAIINDEGKLVVGSVSSEGIGGETSGTTTMVCRPATAKQVTYQYDNENDPSLPSSHMAVEVGSLPSEVSNKYAYGVTYMCNPGDGVERAFFILEDGDNTTLTKSDFSTTHYETDNYGTTSSGEVSLIMAENLISNATICAEPSATCNAVTARETLATQTSAWTVDVNLPTYAQVKQANGNSVEKLASWFYSNLAHPAGGSVAPSSYMLGTIGGGSYQFNIYTADGLNYAPYTALPIRPVITIQKNQMDI